MRILIPTFDLEAFFEQVAQAERRALLLDYDGTLAPFQVDRDKAVPYQGVTALLQDIQAAGHTRLALVSGRAVRDLLPLLEMERPPEVWGSHGWERAGPGGYTLVSGSQRQAEGMAEARAWLRASVPPAQFEDKPASVALHWRGLEAAEAERLSSMALGALEPLVARADLALHAFDGGVELRMPGRDKGVAARELLAEIGPGAAVAYLGDDLTDEDAFVALEGRGARILVRSELRPTAADVWLRPPEELLAFLERWHRMSGG